MSYTLIVALIIGLATIATSWWLCWQMLQQNGRLLLRIEALEKRLDEAKAENGKQKAEMDQADARPHPGPLPLGEGEAQERESRFGNRLLANSKIKRDGLEAGTVAPEFRLPRLDGSELALPDLRGRVVLLVFSSPHCGPCNALAPKLEKFYRKSRRYGHPPSTWPCPSAATLNLGLPGNGVNPKGIPQPSPGLRGTSYPGSVVPGASNPKGVAPEAHGRGRNPVGVDSTLLRFPRVARKLATLGWKTQSLWDWPQPRSRVVADDKAPEEGEAAPAFELVMISKESVEENRHKVKEHGLTFPVVLQKQWEVSRDYAMFATPVAYLLDHAGVIAADVAVGVDAVLELTARARQMLREDGKAMERSMLRRLTGWIAKAA